MRSVRKYNGSKQCPKVDDYRCPMRNKVLPNQGHCKSSCLNKNHVQKLNGEKSCLHSGQNDDGGPMNLPNAKESFHPRGGFQFTNRVGMRVWIRSAHLVGSPHTKKCDTSKCQNTISKSRTIRDRDQRLNPEKSH